ncbi:MAG: hypothetical protein EZS28_037218 [Streblomastix strix]|uniref:Uncharacterized protein n=1 Tax=Streblomastix strix TaxID=222440 RepID=A0A5J4UCD3_9EUKA|nr:MAG: hypothetical protein EZS28_037218 [Streblomastix strix]
MVHHRVDEDYDDNQQINQQNRNYAEYGAQNADANQKALPNWLNFLLSRLRDAPNAIRAQQQHDATTKLFEHHYGRKASDSNIANERAIKKEQELLFQREEEMLGLELNKKGVSPSIGDDYAKDYVETALLTVLILRTCVAASIELIRNGFPITQRFIFTCHHVAGVIVGVGSQRRDVKLVADEFKPLIGTNSSALNMLTKMSKDQIKELYTSIKLIASKSPTPQKKQSFPTLQQLLVIAVIIISELVLISIITSQLNSTVLQPISNDDAIVTICTLINVSTLLSTIAINRPDATITTIVFLSKWCIAANYRFQTSIVDAWEEERGA